VGESVKLAARKRALQQRTEMRSRRVQRDRRLDDAALALLLALAERDAAVEDSERRASEALRTMSDEGLSLRDAVAWAGNKITFREAARLRRLVAIGTSRVARLAGLTGTGSTTQLPQRITQR